MRKNTSVFHIVCIAAVLFALLATSGCSSRTSVRHLNRKPWVLGSEQSLDMKFWRFEYSVVSLDNRLEVSGKAFPLETIPAEVRWVHELWMESYLCDQSGRVLAKDLKTFAPRKLDGEGLPFTFRLKPTGLGSRELFITFGYRIELMPYPPGEGDAEPNSEDVFFAHEGELATF